MDSQGVQESVNTRSRQPSSASELSLVSLNRNQVINYNIYFMSIRQLNRSKVDLSDLVDYWAILFDAKIGNSKLFDFRFYNPRHLYVIRLFL